MSGCALCGTHRYVLVYKEPGAPQEPVASPAQDYTISETFIQKPSRLVRCLGCGFIYALVAEGDRERIRRAYEEMDDPDYVKEERGRRAQARKILSKLKVKAGGKLLDVGCGPGFFLDEARRAGWDVQGLDLSKWAQTYAREHFGIEVLTGALEEAGFPERSFDVIVMNDVLEHLEDPKSTIRHARKILKNDGVLYVSTPDIDSALSRLLGARWWGINLFHLVYFSRTTLEKMFEEVGFKVQRYFSYPRVFSIGYWAKRLSAYPKAVSWPMEQAAKRFPDKLLSVTLHDQIGVLAGKVQRLDTLFSEETAPHSNPAVQKTTVVLPAYNAEKTLERTVADIPKEAVQEIILVDDASQDRTVEIAERLGLVVYRHEKNRGYGANQKTCYAKALERGADVVVMCHPDYQYDPKIIPQLIEPILQGRADAVFGSRMMKGGALEGGMPLWKHNANILLTAFENVMLGTYLTEYHSGFRAYSARLLRTIRFAENSDGFVFDTEIIVQILANRFRIEEVPIRTRYFEEASSIRLWPSVLYGLGILRTMGRFLLHDRGVVRKPSLLPKTDAHGR